MRWRFLLSLFGGLAVASRLPAQMETRVYDFRNASPALVEKQIRFLVPEEQRVTLNAEAGRVLVVADPPTHDKIASMLERMDRPPTRLHFRMRHNREVSTFAVRDGVPVTLPVSSHPPDGVVEQARMLLPADRQDLPVAGTALEAHVKLLRAEDPAMVRLRVTPAVAFGEDPPYQVVRFDPLAMDLMLTSREYLELTEALAGHDFYRGFLRTRPGPDRPARPVGMLLSLDRVDGGGE